MAVFSVVLLLLQPQNQYDWNQAITVLVWSLMTVLLAKLKTTNLLGESGHFYVEKSMKRGCPKTSGQLELKSEQILSL
jgi:hypothetical protein